MFNNNYS